MYFKKGSKNIFSVIITKLYLFSCCYSVNANDTPFFLVFTWETTYLQAVNVCKWCLFP